MDNVLMFILSIVFFHLEFYIFYSSWKGGRNETENKKKA